MGVWDVAVVWEGHCGSPCCLLEALTQNPEWVTTTRTALVEAGESCWVGYRAPRRIQRPSAHHSRALGVCLNNLF
jgi:hypothetical protein